jgi:hypothetical protein
MVSRASSEAEAWEVDSGMEMETQVCSEAKAQQPDLGMDLNRWWPDVSQLTVELSSCNHQRTYLALIWRPLMWPSSSAGVIV